MNLAEEAEVARLQLISSRLSQVLSEEVKEMLEDLHEGLATEFQDDLLYKV